jgi:hypothetical protein
MYTFFHILYEDSNECTTFVIQDTRLWGEELQELSNGKGKLAEASEEGQGPRRTVEPMIMIGLVA